MTLYITLNSGTKKSPSDAIPLSEDSFKGKRGSELDCVRGPEPHRCRVGGSLLRLAREWWRHLLGGCRHQPPAALVHVGQDGHRVAVLAQPQQVLRSAPVARPTAQHHTNRLEGYPTENYIPNLETTHACSVAPCMTASADAWPSAWGQLLLQQERDADRAVELHMVAFSMSRACLMPALLM